MATHHLKTHPEPFAALAIGAKTCEFRKNDRGFCVGDTLVLLEYIPESGERGKERWVAGHYSGAVAFRLVTHILHEGYGMPEGYCLMSLSGSSFNGWPTEIPSSR